MSAPDTERQDAREAEMVAPWHCGSQFADWLDRNCERCVKYEPEGPPAACEIDQGIMQTMLDGEMPRDLAERCGWVDGEHPYTWDCPERVLSPVAMDGPRPKGAA